MPSVRVVDPPEKADLALVNAGRATRGQAPLAASLRWTCQHSCPEETIPACDRFDCEGTLIDDDSPLLPERYAIQHGDVSACKALRVTVCIADVDCDANELIRVVARYAGSEKLDVHPGSASSICIVFEAPAHVRNHPYGLGAEPGQYLGPDARVVVRVDTDSARAVAKLAKASLALDASHPPATEAFTTLLQQVTLLIGLAVPSSKGRPDDGPLVRAVRYVRQLLISQPIVGGSAGHLEGQ